MKNNTPDGSYELPESHLGIIYSSYFTPVFIPILIRGEHEWLSRAVKTYGGDAGEVWAEDILSRLQRGKLQRVDIEDMQLFTPKLLEELMGKEVHNSSLTYIRKYLNNLNSGL